MEQKKTSIIRRIVTFIAIFFAVIVLLWSAIIGLVATPQVITPQIQHIGQQYIKSDFTIKSVDLSLFDRFPNITLRIDSLRITQTKDSIRDLLFARECKVSVNPVALLFKNVVINNFSLRDASLYVYVDSLNGPLKTFRLPEPVEQDTLAESSDFDFSKYTLSIKRFAIDSANLVIDDRVRRFYTRVENYNLDVAMNLSSKISDLDVATGFDNLIVWNDGDLLVKKTSMGVRSQMEFDMDSMKLSFDEAHVKLNGIDLKAQGQLQRDSLQGGVAVDVQASLNTPSLTEFLALVPNSIIDGADKITTQGSVALDLDIKGIYGENSMPTLGATLKVEDAKAKYASRKLALESVNCDAYMFVDMNNPQDSYSDVKKLQINTSKIIDLNFSGKVTNLIDDPHVNMSIRSTIDFDRFTEVFPLNEAIVLKGSNRSDFKTEFTLSDIERSNYANLYLDGESKFSDLEISVDASKLTQDTTQMAYLYMKAQTGTMLFGDNVLSESNSRTLRSIINFSGLGYKSKAGEYVSIKDIELRMGANFDRKTSEMNGVGARAIAKNMEVGIDSLFSSSFESSDALLTLVPKSEKGEARLMAKVESQQITANEPTFNSNIKLSTVNMDLNMMRIEERVWDIKGNVGFADYEMFTDLFPLDIKIPQTSVEVTNKTIHLTNAQMSIGKSHITATGHLNNMMQKLLVNPKLAISGELAVNASYVDFTELMQATNNSVLLAEESQVEVSGVDTLVTSEGEPLPKPEPDTVAVAEVAEPAAAADSIPESSLFLVPRKVNFVFDLNIAKARFEEAIIEDVVGRAQIKNGSFKCDKLSLKAIGAEANGTLLYQNIHRTGANFAADMDFKGIDINRIGELMPTINTMMPMLKSFHGTVDYKMKINTQLTSDSMLDMSTLRSAMSFDGRDLVLMDSETFASLSKMMMFKNKKRNMIDHVEAYALVEGSTIEVLPFLMTIDRYKAVIGGKQDVNPETFDVDYAYNVSILKSPLPFKAGVDINGDLNDFDFKITKAKLKNTNFDKQRQLYEEYRDAIPESIVVEKNRRRKKLADIVAKNAVDTLAVDSLDVDSLAVDSLAVDSLARDTMSLVQQPIESVDSIKTDSIELINNQENKDDK